MYIPLANKIEDLRTAHDFIENHGFATLITQQEGIPWASHLPVLLDKADGSLGTLRSHMARANEQWRHFDPTREILCIFHGPHSYISPSWYVSKTAVPTWNYAVVHVYGYPKIEHDPDFLLSVVNDTTEKYEKDLPQPWKMSFPESTIDGLLKAHACLTKAFSGFC